MISFCRRKIFVIFLSLLSKEMIFRMQGFIGVYKKQKNPHFIRSHFTPAMHRRVPLVGTLKGGFGDLPIKAGVPWQHALTCSLYTEEAAALGGGSCPFVSHFAPFSNTYPCFSTAVSMRNFHVWIQKTKQNSCSLKPVNQLVLCQHIQAMSTLPHE